MMIENATVVAYANGIATVQCYAKAGCGSCSAQANCGTTALSALAGEKTAPRFDLAVSEPLAVGAKIQIGLPEQTLLQGVLWLYGLPLCVLLVSALGFSALFQNELGVAACAGVCTVAAFAVVRALLKRRNLRHFEPIYLGKSPIQS